MFFDLFADDAQCPSDADIASHADKLRESNSLNVACYDQLLDKLCDLVESGNLRC